MNGPSHHPSEDLLLDYASGGASEAVALLVATHLALCPRCRAEVATLEALGGALMSAEESVSDDLLEDTLRRLGQVPAPSQAELPKVAAVGDELLFPEPLRSYIGGAKLSDLPWKSNLGGRVRELELDLRYGSMPVRLVRVQAGFAIPRHTHEGHEMTMPLAGGFEDLGDHFVRGDIAIRDASIEHAVDFDDDSECVALVVNSGKLLPRGVGARLMGLFVDF